MNNLKSKIALVTGASQGIGRGIALELGRSGATVIVNYRDADNLAKAENVVGEIKAAGGNAVAMECDVTDSAAVAKLFKNIKAKFGRIVFTTSAVGHRGALFGHVHYAATKAGQMGMVKTLARTGAPFNINVNAVAPGIVDTELLHKTHGDDGVEALAKTIPLGIGNVSDIGNAVAFLCSDDARYITGITLDVNGGTYFR